MLKKRLVVGLASWLLIFGVVGVAGATLIDFDNSPEGPLSPGDVLRDQYSSFGVTFTAFEGDGVVDSYVDNHWSPVSGNYWSNDTLDHSGTPERMDVLRIMFSEDASDISFDYFNSYASFANVTFNYKRK